MEERGPVWTEERGEVGANLLTQTGCPKQFDPNGLTHESSKNSDGVMFKSKWAIFTKCRDIKLNTIAKIICWKSFFSPNKQKLVPLGVRDQQMHIFLAFLDTET